MLKTLLAGTASVALATIAMTAAIAQTAPSTLVEISDAVAVPGFNLMADQVDDLDVYTAEGVDAGDVEEVIGTDAQTPTHLQIDFDGDDGSVYPDRDDVLVPLESVSLSEGRVILALSPDDIATLPTRDDD